MWPFKRRKKKEPFVCPHKGLGSELCKKYGCPDDPDWHGDGCR